MSNFKLQFGCGKDKKEGYINCDISEEVDPDMIIDITKPMPFEDNTVDEIIMNHVLEHTHEPIKVMKELYRISSDQALIKIRVPYFSHESAFSQIDHYSFFSLTTFDCLDAKHYGHWQGVGNFQTIKKRLHFRGPYKLLTFVNWHRIIARVYQEVAPWILPAKEMEVWLKVIK